MRTSPTKFPRDHQTARRPELSLAAHYAAALVEHTQGEEVREPLARARDQIIAWNTQLDSCGRTKAKECDRLLNHDLPRQLHSVVAQLQFLSDHPQILQYRNDEPVLREALTFLEDAVQIMMATRL